MLQIQPGYLAWTESALFGFDNVLLSQKSLSSGNLDLYYSWLTVKRPPMEAPSVLKGCLSCSCTVDSCVAPIISYLEFQPSASAELLPQLSKCPQLSLHLLLWARSRQFQKLIFWESRFVQLASACGKYPSEHLGCLSYGCKVNSSVYQTFHARLCEFSLQSALFTAESVSQPSAATAVCMSSTESALFGFDIFLPISKVHLSTMICTARWQSSFCLWENPSVHIDSWSRSWMVDSFFAPISWWSISRIQAFTQTRL